MFQKLVCIEPVHLVSCAQEELHHYAHEVIVFDDIPADNAEIIRRIGNADAVLLSYTSRIDRQVFEACPNIRYVGMCCSLYSKESANVDIAWAEQHGITVKGIRDYGDRGVVEFALSELIRFLHGYDRPLLQEMPIEITGLKVGIIGLGVSGGMLAEALRFMGAEVSYFSRSRKPEREAAGIGYLPLHTLLNNCDVVFCCLNKNVLLLDKAAFQSLGNGKLLCNTSIGPAFQCEDLKDWLESSPKNYFICDTKGAIGDPTRMLEGHQQIFCSNHSAGLTRQAYALLSKKVLENIRSALALSDC